jgi:hypothetical protein
MNEGGIFMRSLVAGFMLLMVLPTYAGATEDQVPHPMRKLAAGVVEIVESPKHLYLKTKDEMEKEESKPLGFVKGVLVSPFHMLHQAGNGLTKVLTFPIK